MNEIAIIARAQPFGAGHTHLRAPEGLTLAEMMELHDLDRNGVQARVWIGSYFVPRQNWRHVRPKAHAVLTVSLVPQGGGGGGKNPLRTILSIAVLAAGAAFGPALGAALVGQAGATVAGFTISAASIGSAVIGIAGNLLVSALAPPARAKLNSLSPADQSKDSPTLFIEGARNELRPFGVTPCVLGRHRFVPPLGAKNYTETIGDQQFVRQVFLWGTGPLVIRNLKIGDTAIESFADVEIETSYNQGAAPAFSLYPAQVDQTDYSIKLLSGVWETRTSPPEAEELLLDLTFPQGLVGFSDTGAKQSRTVALEAEYKLTSASTWTAWATPSYTRQTTAAVRETLRVTVPKGQYDIRVKRVTVDNTSTSVFEDVYLTAIRGITYAAPISEKDVVATAIRMRATDQMNGVIDTLSGEASSVCLDWDKDTETWIERETSNPASLFRYVLQGVANHRPLPDNRIDLFALADWHEFCEANGFTFNAVIDYETSVREVLSDIAAAGRASPTIIDGLWSIVIDREKTVPIQHFTPRNSWGYKGERAFPEIPHALRVQFINEDKDWRQDERIVFDDGYTEENATRYETLELFGITNAEAVYKHAREHLATLRLRPETHSFYVDVENLVATRGDLVLFSHDVPLIGICAGRVKSLIMDEDLVTGLTLDEPCPMETGKTYRLRVRQKNGFEIYPLVTIPGEHFALSFMTPVPLEDAPEIDDLFSYGETGKETIQLVIQAIEPGNDLTARLRCVNAAPEIFLASQGEIPAFVSNVTAPLAFTRPAPPVIVGIQTGEEVMVRNLDGSVATRMVITLDNINAGSVEPVVRIRAAGETSYRPADVVSATASRVVLENLDDGKRYDLIVYYQRPGGSIFGSLLSVGMAQNNVLFQGASARPDDVTNFTLTVLDQTALLSWDSNRNIDFDHYEIRFSPEIEDVVWGGAAVLHRGIREPRVITPLQRGTYLIKAVDRSGLYSLNAVAVVSTQADLQAINVVEVINEHPDFAGTHDNTVLDGDFLVIETIALNEGLYNFAGTVDLGNAYVSRITPRFVVVGKNTSNVLSSWGSLLSVESLSGADPSAWQVTLEGRMTDDDPESDPAWSPWRELPIGDYRFRAIEFRLRLLSLAPNVTPAIRQASTSIDMPDRILPIKDITIEIGGTRVDFVPPFKKLRSALITAQSLQSGDRWVKTGEDETGLTIEFFNAANESVERTLDLTAVGYGRVQT